MKIHSKPMLFMALTLHLCTAASAVQTKNWLKKSMNQVQQHLGSTGRPSGRGGETTDIIKSSFPITSFKKMAPKLTDSDPLWRERCSKVKLQKQSPADDGAP